MTFSSKASSSSPRLLETLLDLGGHALVARLGGHLPEQARLLRAAREILEGGDGAGQLGALLHEGLRLAGVVPEAGRGHLGVDQAESGLLGGEVKDALGDRRAACRARPRHA